MTGQEKMEAHLEKTVYENCIMQEGLINGMMKAEAVGCSYDDKTLTFAFPIQEWQANRVGVIHGGILATCFDFVLSALARFYAGEFYAPTVSMDVKYVRPGEVGDRLIVTAKATSTGRRITQLTAEACSEKTGKLIGTAAGVFMNIDTMKERGR